MTRIELFSHLEVSLDGEQSQSFSVTCSFSKHSQLDNSCHLVTSVRYVPLSRLITHPPFSIITSRLAGQSEQKRL